jgi:hypothetical protein
MHENFSSSSPIGVNSFSFLRILGENWDTSMDLNTHEHLAYDKEIYPIGSLLTASCSSQVQSQHKMHKDDGYISVALFSGYLLISSGTIQYSLMY